MQSNILTLLDTHITFFPSYIFIAFTRTGKHCSKSLLSIVIQNIFQWHLTRIIEQVGGLKGANNQRQYISITKVTTLG